MLDFHIPTFDDKKWINKVLDGYSGFGSENTFGSIYLWRNFFGTKVCSYANCLLRKYSFKDIPVGYAFPLRAQNCDSDCLKIALDALFKESRSYGLPFVLTGITKEDLEYLKGIYTGQFKFMEQRNSEDYIYLSSDLISINEKKFHSKRNHISKFNKLHKFSYEDVSETNLEEVLLFIDSWFKDNGDTGEEGLNYESSAIKEFLNNYEYFNFKSGILKIDGKVVAFTSGEEISQNVFVIHFEKALKEYDGSYSVINNEFAKRNLRNYTYINREEDMGIPGLRRSKLSYHPKFLLKRYQAIYLGKGRENLFL